MTDARKVQRRQPAEAAEWLVVLLHGYGSNGKDMISFADLWQDAMPGVAFAAPDAPTPCDEAGGAFQWVGRRPAADPRLLEELKEAAPGVNAFCDEELARHELDADRLMLVGFSQGTLMALHVGLRREVQPVGILGYGGGLLGPETLKSELRSKPPVMLINGTADAHAPPEGMARSIEALNGLGVVAHGQAIEGLGHSVNMDALVLGGRFLVSAMGYRARHGAPAVTDAP